MKKRGFGAGKFNGFGGKLDPKETIMEGALREMAEESGLVPTDATLRGNIVFEFEGNPELLEVHVFKATQWLERREPEETEEMKPEWFPEASVPFERMWIDDAQWLPIVLKRPEDDPAAVAAASKEGGALLSAGQCFKAYFLFSGHEKIVSQSIELLKGPEELPHRADAVLVTAKQGAITA